MARIIRAFAVVGDGLLDAGMELIAKPFAMDALTARVRTMGGRASGGRRRPPSVNRAESFPGRCGIGRIAAAVYAARSRATASLRRRYGATRLRARNHSWRSGASVSKLPITRRHSGARHWQIMCQFDWLSAVE